MHFLISDGGQGRHHHVETVKPRPPFDVVIPCSADGDDQHQEQPDFFKMAKRGHQRSVSVASCQLSVVRIAKIPTWNIPAHELLATYPRFPIHDYKTKRP